MPVARSKITDAIRRTGLFAVTVVAGPTPRWQYTIGLTQAGLPEVVVAGSAAYRDATLDALLRSVGSGLLAGAYAPDARGLRVEGVDVDLMPVHVSWAQRLLVVAATYHERPAVDAVQAVPSGGWIDIPRTSVPLDLSIERPWRWLDDEWPYACSSRTRVFTDLDVLRGSPIVEVIHEREPGGLNSWTMRAHAAAAGAEQEGRVVPIGTVLAIDPTVALTLDLKPGEFAVRDGPQADWQAWELPSQ